MRAWAGGAAAQAVESWRARSDLSPVQTAATSFGGRGCAGGAARSPRAWAAHGLEGASLEAAVDAKDGPAPQDDRRQEDAAAEHAWMNSSWRGGGSKFGPSGKFLPHLDQVGDTILLLQKSLGQEGKNWVVGTTIGFPNKGYFCGDPDSRRQLPALPVDRHPAFELAFPVRNLHVSIVNKGAPGKAATTPHMVWDAEFAADRATRRISARDKPEGGFKTQWAPLCPKKGETIRLEMRVTGDDPREVSTEAPLAPKDPKRPDRSLDETAVFDAQLLPAGDPRLPKPARQKRMPRTPRGAPPPPSWGPFRSSVGPLATAAPAPPRVPEVPRARRPRRRAGAGPTAEPAWLAFL